MQCSKVQRQVARSGQYALTAALRASGRLVSATKRAGTAKSCLLLVLAIVPADARSTTIETEHLFGFTIGSDVGDVGERDRGLRNRPIREAQRNLQCGLRHVIRGIRADTKSSNRIYWRGGLL
jgi:hypothetical protein